MIIMVTGTALMFERARNRAIARMAEANEQAGVASRVKSEFLANMSHEMRIPMMAILGFAEYVQDDDLDSK